MREPHTRLHGRIPGNRGPCSTLRRVRQLSALLFSELVTQDTRAAAIDSVRAAPSIWTESLVGVRADDEQQVAERVFRKRAGAGLGRYSCGRQPLDDAL